MIHPAPFLSHFPGKTFCIYNWHKVWCIVLESLPRTRTGEESAKRWSHCHYPHLRSCRRGVWSEAAYTSLMSLLVANYSVIATFNIHALDHCSWTTTVYSSPNFARSMFGRCLCDLIIVLQVLHIFPTNGQPSPQAAPSFPQLHCKHKQWYWDTSIDGGLEEEMATDDW